MRPAASSCRAMQRLGRLTGHPQCKSNMCMFSVPSVRPRQHRGYRSSVIVAMGRRAAKNAVRKVRLLPLAGDISSNKHPVNYIYILLAG